VALAFGADRAHAGNRGYADELASHYDYDSLVQNSKQVRSGDIILVADKTALYGIARIGRIDQRAGTKELSRCPTCGTTGFKARKRISPRFRCRYRHQFDDAVVDRVECTKYRAFFSQFVPARAVVSLAELRMARTDEGLQMAIAPVDLAALRRMMIRRLPEAVGLLS